MKEEKKKKLQDKQWEVAMEGNVQMLIWLGKQYLGQQNEPPMDTSRPIDDIVFIEDGKPIIKGI